MKNIIVYCLTFIFLYSCSLPLDNIDYENYSNSNFQIEIDNIQQEKNRLNAKLGYKAIKSLIECDSTLQLAFINDFLKGFSSLLTITKNIFPKLPLSKRNSSFNCGKNPFLFNDYCGLYSYSNNHWQYQNNFNDKIVLIFPLDINCNNFLDKDLVTVTCYKYKEEFVLFNDYITGNLKKLYFPTEFCFDVKQKNNITNSLLFNYSATWNQHKGLPQNLFCELFIDVLYLKINMKENNNIINIEFIITQNDFLIWQGNLHLILVNDNNKWILNETKIKIDHKLFSYFFTWQNIKKMSSLNESNISAKLSYLKQNIVSKITYNKQQVSFLNFKSFVDFDEILKIKSFWQFNDSSTTNFKNFLEKISLGD